MKFSVEELMTLGQLAGYSKSETARMILEADDRKRAEKAGSVRPSVPDK